MFENMSIPEEAKSKEFKEIENNYYNSIDKNLQKEKTAPATGEILIDEKEFDVAKDKVINEMINDPEHEGIAKLIITMTGVIFATKMKEILFGKNKEV